MAVKTPVKFVGSLWGGLLVRVAADCFPRSDRPQRQTEFRASFASQAAIGSIGVQVGALPLLLTLCYIASFRFFNQRND